MTQGTVEVAVLGPVVVHGAAEPFRRSAARELVVYLAFHRGGVRHGEWSLALWPERPVSLSTVHSTASDARRALGGDAEGRLHLPRGVDLRLSDSVTTDVERFASLAAANGPYELLQAMRLVRGPLFGGLRRADWAVFDGTRSGIESSVVDVAVRGATAYAETGRAEVAEWMVRRALVVCPFDERLYRSLLVATAAQGDRTRLPRTMSQLLALAGDDGGSHGGMRCWPGRATPSSSRLGCLHPETAALYRDLLQGEPAAGGHPVRL